MMEIIVEYHKGIKGITATFLSLTASVALTTKQTKGRNNLETKE